MLRLVLEGFADLTDTLGDAVVGDHHIRPHRLHDRVAVEQAPGILDEQPQQGEDFGRKVLGTISRQ